MNKIGQELLKLQSKMFKCGRNDGRTDRLKTVYPPKTFCGGYNKQFLNLKFQASSLPAGLNSDKLLISYNFIREHNLISVLLLN